MLSVYSVPFVTHPSHIDIDTDLKTNISDSDTNISNSGSESDTNISDYETDLIKPEFEPYINGKFLSCISKFQRNDLKNQIDSAKTDEDMKTIIDNFTKILDEQLICVQFCIIMKRFYNFYHEDLPDEFNEIINKIEEKSSKTNILKEKIHNLFVLFEQYDKQNSDEDEAFFENMSDCYSEEDNEL
jgi:hypothetical protein